MRWRRGRRPSRSRFPPACARFCRGSPSRSWVSRPEPEEDPRGMLTEEDDVEIHALAARGWTVAAISRHTGRDPKTIRKYLTCPGQARRERAPSCLEPFRDYLVARLAEDPHVDGTVLFPELAPVGLDR